MAYKQNLALRNKQTRRVACFRRKVVEAQHSSDGETSKLLLELQDGLTVEAVIMHYDTSGAFQYPHSRYT